MGVGPLGAMVRNLEWQEALGEEDEPLQEEIRQHPLARAFVCAAGVPAILTLWETRPAGPLCQES
jgi:hypothetical protein